MHAYENRYLDTTILSLLLSMSLSESRSQSLGDNKLCEMKDKTASLRMQIKRYKNHKCVTESSVPPQYSICEH